MSNATQICENAVAIELFAKLALRTQTYIHHCALVLPGGMICMEHPDFSTYANANHLTVIWDSEYVHLSRSFYKVSKHKKITFELKHVLIHCHFTLKKYL